MSKVNKLLPYRATPVLGRIVTRLLGLLGVHLPASVAVGADFLLPHRDGVVIHPNTVIGDRVTVFHQTTIGLRHTGLAAEDAANDRVVLEDDVIVYPGAKVLGGRGTTVLGRGSVVAANAVLLGSTGPGEIWAGVPARCIGRRSGEVDPLSPAP